ncbi:MAG: hypothetical protein FJZ10_02020 [Candidatus Omnitrophica bacterium]|nr:hypothetical protein [Candidatus Omnitrophota bacterium]
MSDRLTTSLSINNFRLKVITNDRKIFHLIKEQLDTPNPKQIKKPDFEILFNLERTDFYKIPRTKRDVFKEEPLFQDEHIADSKIIIDVGFRSLQVNIDPKKDYVHVCIARGQDFIDRNLFFDLVFFQPLRFLLRFHKIYVLHAACLAKGQSAILLPGVPGSGKSIVSLSLVRKGYKYLTDDDTFLRQKGGIVECFAFYCSLKIKDGLVRFFPEMKKKYLKPIRQDKKQRVDLKKLYPNSFQEKAIPKVIIFPCFSAHLKTGIYPVDKRYVLRRLIEDKFRVFQGKYEDVSRLHFQALSNLVNKTKTYKLIYKDQDIDIIPELMGKLL